MRKRLLLTEATYASVVVDHFEAIGADVYQEVACAGGVADIVALVAAELWVIEVKTSLSLALIVQALERRRDAHRVFVAAPYSRNFRDVGALCAELGIGLLQINSGEYDPHTRSRTPWRVVEVVGSRRWNSRPVALRAKLSPEHKTHAQAGSVGGGGRWTPFRDTCEQLARVVQARPGITLKDATSRIRHHYATPAGARSSLAHWIALGKVDGVRFDRSGKVAVLVPHAEVALESPVSGGPTA